MTPELANADLFGGREFEADGAGFRGQDGAGAGPPQELEVS